MKLKLKEQYRESIRRAGCLKTKQQNKKKNWQKPLSKTIIQSDDVKWKGNNYQREEAAYRIGEIPCQERALKSRIHKELQSQAWDK